MEKNKFIWTVKVGDKGQIVIPKEARDIFNIKKGDSLIMFGDIKKGIAISNFAHKNSGRCLWELF